MNLRKLAVVLLLLTTAFSALQLTSCKDTSDAPENPFAVDKMNSHGDNQSNADPETGWIEGQSTGEKHLYGKEPLNSILRYGDMLIGTTSYSNLDGYFSFEKPDDAKLICFDPHCRHWKGLENCPAAINFFHNSEAEPGKYYPMGMYIDQYESVDAPVIYYYYRRNYMYTINAEEAGYRDPVYCIERYDLSQGKRYAILDNVENTIQQACNYGDYVYYVLDISDGKNQMQKLCRVHKSGSEPEEFDLTELPQTLKIIDGIDDQLYYLVNERYLYRCTLDLTDSEMVLDMSSVKGKDGSNGVVAGSYSGYLYYFADVETVRAGEEEGSASDEKCNLYRIPMDELTNTPETVVTGMLYRSDCYRFTEETFYYVPCVFKYVDDDKLEKVETAVNLCDGKLMALDLKTNESKTIVENSGMTIFVKYAWDDIVVFSGWAYDESGLENSGGNGNLLLAYTSGQPYKIWCGKYAPGAVTDEYLASLRGK